MPEGHDDNNFYEFERYQRWVLGKLDSKLKSKQVNRIIINILSVKVASIFLNHLIFKIFIPYLQQNKAMLKRKCSFKIKKSFLV